MKKTLFLIIFSSIFTVVGFSQADLQPAAIVNLTKSEPITVKQFRTEVERMEKSAGRPLSQSDRTKLLDTIINEKLVIQAAERDKVTITENEVNQQMQQFRSVMAQQIGRQPTEAEFVQAIKNESGMELPAFREQLRRQLIIQKYLMAKKENVINSVKQPTDDEVRSKYNLKRADFTRPETIRFSMIQVEYGPDAASRRKAKELADSLVKEIGSNPTTFNAVVTRGMSPNAGFQAGDAGYLPMNEEAENVVGSEFLNIAFNLKEGEVSKLIEGTVGYQMIKVTEKHAMQNLGLDDIFQLGTRVTVKEYIKQALLAERQQAIIAQATQELISELRTGKTFQIFEKNLKW